MQDYLPEEQKQEFQELAATVQEKFDAFTIPQDAGHKSSVRACLNQALDILEEFSSINCGPAQVLLSHILRTAGYYIHVTQDMWYNVQHKYNYDFCLERVEDNYVLQALYLEHSPWAGEENSHWTKENADLFIAKALALVKPGLDLHYFEAHSRNPETYVHKPKVAPKNSLNDFLHAQTAWRKDIAKSSFAFVVAGLSTSAAGLILHGIEKAGHPEESHRQQWVDDLRQQIPQPIADRFSTQLDQVLHGPSVTSLAKSLADNFGWGITAGISLMLAPSTDLLMKCLDIKMQNAAANLLEKLAAGNIILDAEHKKLIPLALKSGYDPNLAEQMGLSPEVIARTLKARKDAREIHSIVLETAGKKIGDGSSAVASLCSAIWGFRGAQNTMAGAAGTVAAATFIGNIYASVVYRPDFYKKVGELAESTSLIEAAKALEATRPRVQRNGLWTVAIYTPTYGLGAISDKEVKVWSYRGGYDAPANPADANKPATDAPASPES